MNTKKFEYLETIRETVEQGEYEELREFLEDIREAVKHDPDFTEIFQEVSTGKYRDVISLIDDIIYKEMQAEFESYDQDAPPQEVEEDLPAPDVNEFSLEFDFDEDIKEEISFEPFDDEGYFEKTEEDH